MADLKISGQKVYLGAFDITGDLRSIGFGVSAADLDKTTLGCSTVARWSGLKDFSLSHEGLWQAGDTPDLIDHIMWDKYAIANEVVTIGPTTGADGELGYFLRTMYMNYEAGGSVGEIFAFNGSTVASAEPVVRGTIIHNAKKTVTGTGTARLIGPALVGVPNKRTVTNATNATPIQITTSAAHGYTSGHSVSILDVGGNLAANGANRPITVVDATNFTIDNSVGSAAYTSGGYVLGPAARKLYAALHIIAVTGTDPTLDVVIQSDAAAACTSPIDRLTFTQASAIGAQWGTPVVPDRLTVTDATNATPIQITTSTAHGYLTGYSVRVAEVEGNTAANGDWTITKVGDTTFTLDTSVGNGDYTTGGYVLGGILDKYWRVSYTIGGTDSPSFTFVVTAGLA